LKLGKLILVLCCLIISISPVYADGTVELTEEELAFIEEHPVITLGIDPSFVPFEFIDINGEYSGLANDYIRLLSGKTGLNMVTVTGLTWTEAYEEAVEGKIDVLPCISKTGNRETYFLFSEPYYQFERVIIMRKDSLIQSYKDLSDTTIAIQKNSSHQGFIEAYEDIKPHFYDTVEDALLAVAEGKEEAFVGNLATSSYMITSLGLTELKYVVFESEEANTLHFAVNKDMPLLKSIIDKGLNQITEAEKIEIHNKWIGLQETVDYTGIIRAVLVIVSTFAVIFGVSFYWILRLRREIKKRIQTEEELRLAKLEAEKANEVKSNFLARMSHEIRTPLNAITGLSYLLQNSDLDKTQKSHLDKIRHAGSIMLSIINDILDFSKIEAGMVEIEHEPFDLDEIIKNVFNIVSYRVEEKGLHFTFVKGPEVPNYFIGDSKRITQVLLNIVNNAVKFTETGEISLTVSLLGYMKDQYQIVFEISDTGIGMSKDHMEHLFEPFTQEDASISRVYGGTGLGLSIVKNLTEMMKGTILVDSDLGKGTTFKLQLELPIDEEKALEVLKNVEHLKNVKTLVLDKDINTLGLIREYLKGFGIDTEFTSSKEQFMVLLESTESKKVKPYDLVIIDEETIGSEFDVQTFLKTNHALKLIFVKTINSMIFEHNRVVTISVPVFPSVLYNGIVDLFQYNVMATHIERPTLPCDDIVIHAKVLIVEDNKTNQLIAKTLLESLDITIDVAENGRVAFDLAEVTTYDLILMDLHMPVMDGYQAAKLIKEIQPDTMIIAMTADAVDGVKEKCHAYGMDYFISKPFDPEHFVKEVCIRLKRTDTDSNEVIINYTLGLKMMGGNKKLYQQVIQVFLEENKNVIESLDNALLNNDYQMVIDVSHKVKGSAGSIGAESVRQLASDLQEAAENSQYDDLQLIKDHFVTHFKQLIKALKEDHY
jgi:signal transduction histidine kinase/DNA-binding response OmpR family regulator